MIAKLTITFRDAKGKKSRTIYHLDSSDFAYSGNLIADIKGWTDEVLLRLDKLILGVIESADLSISLGLPVGLDDFALSTSDVEEKAYFDFPATASGAAFANSIPVFNHAKFPPGTEQMAYDSYEELADFALMLFAPSLALDWPAEYGGISDNRGNKVQSEPIIYKRFKR